MKGREKVFELKADSNTPRSYTSNVTNATRQLSVDVRQRTRTKNIQAKTYAGPISGLITDQAVNSMPQQ
jgi:hypothetical protein